jgi:hypothetical protein
MIREARLFTLGLLRLHPAVEPTAAVKVCHTAGFRALKTSVACARAANFFRIYQHKEMK